jgi:hypothetical protein
MKVKWLINLKRFLTAITIIISCVLSACGDKALLNELERSKLVVVLKGTYETNNPQPWEPPKWGTGPGDINTYENTIQDNSVYRVRTSPVNCSSPEAWCNTEFGDLRAGDRFPSAFMLDIAEIELLNSNSKKYKFANNRQTLVFGLNDSDPFFNGAGMILENDDAPNGVYLFALMYIRKMMFTDAKKYYSSGAGWTVQDVFNLFAERVVPGYNFNVNLINTYPDTLNLAGSSINRVFPLCIPIGFGMDLNNIKPLVNNTFAPYTVLEIRFVVKNFVKKYEVESVENGLYGLTHYWALSDWKIPVNQDEAAIGQVLIAQARFYYPGFTGRVAGTAGASSAERYIIAIPAGENIANFTIPNLYYGVDPVSNDMKRRGTIANSVLDCDLPRAPSQNFGQSIDQALDYFLKLEKYNYEWNRKVVLSPSTPPDDMSTTEPCNTMNIYEGQWNGYLGMAGNFKLPEVATYSGTSGQYSLENIQPGNYDIYYSSKKPVYGNLMYDSEYVLGQANVTVFLGATTTVNLP